jgi:hypothetical protein
MMAEPFSQGIFGPPSGSSQPSPPSLETGRNVDITITSMVQLFSGPGKIPTECLVFDGIPGNDQD